jgi:outer membrane protein assembly factor BamB
LDHRVYAFDAHGCGATSCGPVWQADTGDVVYSSPAVANGVLYVGSQDQKLYAFSAAGTTGCAAPAPGSVKTCTPLWTATVGGSVYSSPAVANGVVYVGSDDGHLYAFDAAGQRNCNGSPKACNPLANVATNGPVQSSPAVESGTVFVGSADGGLYAY